MTEAASAEKDLRVRELTVPATEGQLGRVRDFIVEVCDEADFSVRETSNTKLAVDEACTNIIKHAYSAADSEGDILIRAEIGRGSLSVAIHDHGKRFDFASIEDPDLDQYVETGRKGGLGVFLINRLMDGVEYRSTDDGNELLLTKRSQSAVAHGLLPETRPLRSTLKYKFTMRASTGLFLLVAAIWGFMFFRQTADIRSQRVGQWMEKRRLTENLANRSKDLLLRPDEFSVEQTNLSSYLARLVENNADIAYMRVVDATGNIISSGKIDEIFTSYTEPPGTVLLREGDKVVWKEVRDGERSVRDIGFQVDVRNPETGQDLGLGRVHVGVFEDAMEASIEDGRLMMTLTLVGVFLVGILLIMGLVSVFVKPIQVLTDGVRAIGDGSLDGKLNVEGPAEIGAIAGVFNEITDKFKKAQDSILEQEKMQKEMEVAKEIQHSLLPRQKPEVSGYDIAPLYQAAAEVGGDYYDFVEVDEDTIGVVVADVSGKGVPGSLVMTMIRTALRMEARGNKNASDVMSKMNAFVTDDMKKGMFVTMFYVILDSKNRIISYASAGHNPMILYRHETQETFFLNPKGFPVGISLPDESLFQKSISLEKIKLKKDDMLLIYTDGVTEAMNEHRDQYGEERLIGIIKEYGHLPPEDFIATLERDIKKFTSGHPQNDDITVVAVKEKLHADDVLFGIRKNLIDLVEVQGMSVKDACKQMRVSPATYYRYKKRMEVMGERGLRDKVLRQDTQLKRVSLEARKHILEIIRQHPDYGAKRITAEYNATSDEARHVTERMVYEELKRLNLNTKELRLDYLRRNRLIADERREDREMVEDLLAQFSREGETEDEEIAVEPFDSTSEFELIDGVGLSVSRSEDGITTVRVNGHLDSVTSSTLDERLKALIEEEAFKLIVDLSDVTYISSGGWGIFTGEVRRLRENGGDVVLVGMTSEVYDVYELLGFDELLRAFPNEEGARHYFSLPPEERLAMPTTSPTDLDPTTAAAEHGVEMDEEVPGEAYVPEWESLHIEATTVGERGDIAVLLLRGIIDTVSAETLRAALDRVISQGISRIVVDMSQVEYVSSGGWGTFTERLREVRRNDGDIKLFGMDPDVYYVFTMLGFNIVLSSFDILSDAIEDFKRAPATLEGAAEEGLPASRPRGTPPKKTADKVRSDLLEMAARDREVEDIVKWETSGDVSVAHLIGPIEALAVDALAQSMMQELASQPRFVIFDLADVPYISSSGWGQFARCHEMVQDWQGAVALSGLGGDLYDIYSCLEFQAFIKAYPSVEEAREALEGGHTVPVEPPPGDTRPGETESPGEEEPLDTLSVDDILGDEETAPRPVPPPSLESRSWPGEEVETQESPDDHPVAPENPREPLSSDAAPPRPVEKDAFVDMTDGGEAVDVDGAVADKNIERDRKIREMGWGAYGERLKRSKEKKKGDG